VWCKSSDTVNHIVSLISSLICSSCVLLEICRQAHRCKRTEEVPTSAILSYFELLCCFFKVLVPVSSLLADTGYKGLIFWKGVVREQLAKNIRRMSVLASHLPLLFLAT